MPTLCRIIKTLTAANAAVICASQTPGAAGAMTLVSSPVTLDTQRRVLITCAGNNTGVTFTITGTKDTGQTVTEVVTGVNATTASSFFDYKTITSVVISGASTGAVTVGTSTTGSSDWKVVDNVKTATFGMSFAAVPTGTVTFSLETTNSPILTGQPNVMPTAVTAATATTTMTLLAPVHAWRLTVTAGTGSVTLDAVEAGRK